MNSNRWLHRAAAAAAAALLGACASAPLHGPDREMSEANQALQAAGSIDAAIHAPALYHRAEDAYTQAQAAQQRYDYGEARRLAGVAADAAADAKRFTQVEHDARLSLARADGMGLDDAGAAAMLRRAEELAALESNGTEAIRLAEEARLRLHALLSRRFLKSAGPLLSQARERRNTMDEAQRKALQAAEQAYREGRGEDAYQLASALETDARGPAPAAEGGAPAPASTPTPVRAASAAPAVASDSGGPVTPAAASDAGDRTAHPSTYTVKPGDTLWRIAGRPEVYNNPAYWPLLYRANRGKIPAADTLAAGQVLTIARGVSQADIDAAVDYARRRSTWSPGEVQAIDRAYLHGDAPR